MARWLDMATCNLYSLSHDLDVGKWYTLSVDTNLEDNTPIKVELNLDTYIGGLSREGKLTFKVDTPYQNELRLYTGNYNLVINKLCLVEGIEEYAWSPAPDGLHALKGKQYVLSQLIEPDKWYSLSVQKSIPQDDFLAVWIGDYFAGYVQDGLEFRLIGGTNTSTNKVTLKSLSETGKVSNIKIERGRASNFTLAPEDIGLEYPDDIHFFKPCVLPDGTMLVRRIIEYPIEIEGGRNLVVCKQI